LAEWWVNTLAELKVLKEVVMWVYKWVSYLENVMVELLAISLAVMMENFLVEK
jgi:hypothetical protein